MDNMRVFLLWPFDPIPGHGLLLCEFAITLTDTPQSVGLLWTSDQTDAGTSDNTQHSQEENIHATGGIRTHIPRKANSRRPTP